MAELPLLLFPQARRGLRPKARGFPPTQVKKPGVTRQKERLGPAFRRLESAFSARRATLSVSATGMEPEKALVIEAAGSVGDFQKAVRGITGLEWLGEFEMDDMDPSEEFYYTEKPDKKMPHILYLIMTDQRAVEEIVRLWNFWESEKQKFPRGKTKWRDLFHLCRDIRYWDTEDRLEGTGLIEQLKKIDSDDPISMEIEFWYRPQDRLRASRDRVIDLLKRAGGDIIADAHIDEINYSAIKVSIPAELARQIVDSDFPDFFNEDVIYCLRPKGQCAISMQDSEESGHLLDRPLPEEAPVVAILDGVPFQRHQYLTGRIELDDPQNFSGLYQATQQKHGTAMASLVVHGELDDHNAAALKSKVYMRPVMIPNQVGPNDVKEEFPAGALPVDLVHQAVKEIFERNDGKDFSTIKVINVSLGDGTRPFSRIVSPWARLLDWLSWKYKVLFCVSAGNSNDEIDLEISSGDFGNLTDEEKSRKTILAMAKGFPNRRLLSPAESMNAITVGALHHDLVQRFNPRLKVDIQPSTDLPSPITRLGGGFRNSIKPDIMMPGGRQLYHNYSSQNTTYSVSSSTLPPGHSVASPGTGTGQTDGKTSTRGTSNATALASRGSARIHEALQEIREQNPNAIPDANLAVLMKALLVHGATWGGAHDKLQLLKNSANARTFKRYLSRFLGYGAVDIERVIECATLRATMIGTDSLRMDNQLEYRFPLPPSLSGSTENIRLTITLAWFTPINPGHQNLRQANLSYNPPTKNDYMVLSRKEADWQQVKKGTVQHEVLEGSEASVYLDGDCLTIPVACRKDAGEFVDDIPFGLAVTLEVLNEVDINIYNEIRDRILEPVPALAEAP